MARPTVALVGGCPVSNGRPTIGAGGTRERRKARGGAAGGPAIGRPGGAVGSGGALGAAGVRFTVPLCHAGPLRGTEASIT